MWELLTESSDYGDLARRLFVFGLIALFAVAQVVRAFLFGRISGFCGHGECGADRVDTSWAWYQWRRGVDESFGLVVATYAVVSVVFMSMAYSFLPDLELSPIPTDLNAIQIKPNEVFLTWSKPKRKHAPSKYCIYRDTAPLPEEPSSGKLIYTIGSSSCPDQDVEPGKRYYYRVASKYRWEELRFGEQTSVIVQ